MNTESFTVNCIRVVTFNLKYHQTESQKPHTIFVLLTYLFYFPVQGYLNVCSYKTRETPHGLDYSHLLVVHLCQDLDYCVMNIIQLCRVMKASGDIKLINTMKNVALPWRIPLRKHNYNAFSLLVIILEHILFILNKKNFFKINYFKKN